jgi:hypothetical protein
VFDASPSGRRRAGGGRWRNHHRLRDRKSVGAPLNKVEEQIYALKRRALDALIAERLLAKEAGRRQMSPQALLEAEPGNMEAVTELEIELVST